MSNPEEAHWLSVIAKSLAYLCIQRPETKDLKLSEKSVFLAGLGFTLKQSAEILGTTEASLRELARQAKKAKVARSTKNGNQKSAAKSRRTK